jgi:intracellular sulfur oxidation DsrE/DsrF family protein
MRTILVLLLFCACSVRAAAEPVTGPVVADYGAVYYVPDEPLALAPDRELKAVFDIAAAPDAPGARNHRLETVARHLNLHARAGVQPDRLTTAVVLHGRATRVALEDEVFLERYGEPNPEAELIRRLQRAGVRVIVCGQSATAFGFRPDELAPGVQLSLSALTALVTLQQEGYALIPWGIQ